MNEVRWMDRWMDGHDHKSPLHDSVSLIQITAKRAFLTMTDCGTRPLILDIFDHGTIAVNGHGQMTWRYSFA